MRDGVTVIILCEMGPETSERYRKQIWFVRAPTTKKKRLKAKWRKAQIFFHKDFCASNRSLYIYPRFTHSLTPRLTDSYVRLMLLKLSKDFLPHSKLFPGFRACSKKNKHNCLHILQHLRDELKINCSISLLCKKQLSTMQDKLLFNVFKFTKS